MPALQWGFKESWKRPKLCAWIQEKRPRKILGVRKRGSDVDLGDLMWELFSEFYLRRKKEGRRRRRFDE